MSAPTNDGGPAFPAPAYAANITDKGMTLRDYFAAQALVGISPGVEREINKLKSAKRVNEWYQCAGIRAYCYADAMLAAREGKQ
jgi:hypothetical protein